MKLLDTYFTIKNHNRIEDTDVIDVELNPEHPVYKGHFPDMPVAPGVCNIQMIRECVAWVAQKEMLIENISVCRFSSLVTPSETPLMSIKLKMSATEQNSFNVVAELMTTEKSYMSFKGELKEV